MHLKAIFVCHIPGRIEKGNCRFRTGLAGVFSYKFEIFQIHI